MSGIYSVVRHHAVTGHSYGYRVNVMILGNGSISGEFGDYPTMKAEKDLGDTIIRGEQYQLVTQQEFLAEVARRWDIINSFHYEKEE